MHNWFSMVEKMTAMHSMLMLYSVDSAFSDSTCKTIQYSNIVTNNILMCYSICSKISLSSVFFTSIKKSYK